MNENFYNSRKIRQVNVSGDINKNGNISNSNYSHNQLNTRQTINNNPSANHLTQNILPQLVNLISPQIPVSQSGNQALINMGFNAAPFLQNQLYSIPNTFGALNTISSQSYNTNNVSYINNMRMNHSQPSQAIMNYKENKISSDFNARKSKSDGIIKNNQASIKTTNYPVRLLINSELVGPLIGRKGEKIKEITANTGAKIDIKRESVPYSQFGLNNYMFSGCNRKGNGLSDGDQIVAANNASRGESQIVFIVSEPEKCSAAISEIMQLCTQEAKEQGREEPNMGLLAEDRFCARLIGKEGRFLNWVRCKSGSQVHVSNVPTITTLSEQPHVISLDRIISCRGGGLASLLEAEKLISDKIRQCVSEDHAQKPCQRLAKDDSFLPPRVGDINMNMYNNNNRGGHMYPPPSNSILHDITRQQPSDELLLINGSLRNRLHNNIATNNNIIGSGIVHKANPNWPDNLKLDENLYVRIPQVCAGSIIGSEGKNVRRIMAETGTYIQISKTNLGSIESVPAVHTYRKQIVPQLCPIKIDELNERLITIKGTAPNQCNALTHIFSRVRICYSQVLHNDDVMSAQLHNQSSSQQQQIRLWVLIRVPKLMLGRLIGKEGKVIRQLQLSSRTFLSFPRLRLRDYTTNTINAQQEEETLVDNNNIDDNTSNNLVKPTTVVQADNGTNAPINTKINTTPSLDDIIIQQQDTQLQDTSSAPSQLLTSNNIISPGGHRGQPQTNMATIATNTPSPSINNINTNTNNETSNRIGVSHSNETLHNPDSALFGDNDLHPVEIFGTYEAVEAAIYMIRRLVYSSIFSQFGPALISGPTPQLSLAPSQLPPPFPSMAPPHTLIMPPPMIMSAAAAAAATQRRNSDCPPGPFYANNIAGVAGNGGNGGIHHPPFMHQQPSIRPGNHLVKNYKKIMPYNQRNKTEHRTQSDSKVKIELEELLDNNKKCEKDLNFKEDNNGDIICEKGPIDTECASLSPKSIVNSIKRHQESPAAMFSPQDQAFAQANITHSREDLSQIFNATSPCSYYTDCCPNTPTYLNISTNEDLSFITAQDSFTNMNDSFSDHLSPPNNNNISCPHTQLSQSPPSLQTTPTLLNNQQQQTFSHWSSSPNPPF